MRRLLDVFATYCQFVDPSDSRKIKKMSFAAIEDAEYITIINVARYFI
jgi:hypothetical protein